MEDDSEAVSVTTTVTVWTASELRFQQHRSLRDGGRNRGGNERGDSPSRKPSGSTGSEDAGEHARAAARGADRRAGRTVGDLLGAGTGTGSVDSIDTVDISMDKKQGAVGQERADNAYLVMVTVEEVELLKTKEDVLVLALGVELEADEETVEELPEVDSVAEIGHQEESQSEWLNHSSNGWGLGRDRGTTGGRRSSIVGCSNNDSTVVQAGNSGSDVMNEADASSDTHAHGHKCQDDSEQDRGAARDWNWIVSMDRNCFQASW
ncbi:hypothetical protein PG996_002368 [Apiospora saccharicola]|uniref:Uncharacterized protein n=1 Tax=Apiospora saccharicola TaxID=335842 RepID=A0ABR1WKS6_9PEZI